MQFSARKRVVAAAAALTLLGTGAFSAMPANAHNRYTMGVDAKSKVELGDVVSLESEFSAPKTGTYIIDTEIYDSEGDWVIQFDESVVIEKGQSVTRTYNWETEGLWEDVFTVKQGLFSENWAKGLDWNDRALTTSTHRLHRVRQMVWVHSVNSSTTTQWLFTAQEMTLSHSEEF